MSYQVFVHDLCKETLTMARLEEVWSFHNLANKSPLIDAFAKLLGQLLQSKGPLEPDMVRKICTNFSNAIVRKNIPHVEPRLVDPPACVSGDDMVDAMINPETDIIFVPCKEKGGYMAIRVHKGGRLYKLRMQHVNICITNGWYMLESALEDDIRGDISCPFFVQK